MSLKKHIENIYSRMPVWMQNLIVSVEGYRLNRRRYKNPYPIVASGYEARKTWDYDELEEYRKKRLIAFMKLAAKKTYWKETFDVCGLDLKSSDPFIELKKLPLMNKLIAREFNAKIAGKENPATISAHTSGTTGAGLIFRVTLSSEREQWATWWRYRKALGLQMNDWCGYFGGRSLISPMQMQVPFWRINHPGRQIMFSGYHLSLSTAKHYVNAIKSFNLRWLHGYPSLLSQLAHFILEEKLDCGHSVQMITTGAENLLTTQQEVISRAFSVPVFQHYGQAEGVANFSQCRFGRLHVDEDFSCVEFIPIMSMPGKHRIVGTNWTNSAFPLFRYDTGDIAVILENAQCPCLSTGRIVESVDGRQEDSIVLPNGATIGRLDHIFKDMINVREAQIYQSADGALVFKLVKSGAYTEKDEQDLLMEAQTRLGRSVDIKIQYCDSIPKTASGKLRFVVSDYIRN